MHSQISTHHLIKRFVPYFKKYKGVLFLDLFCAALTTVCELVFPLIVRYITDMGMNHLESLTVQIILTLGGFYLVLRLIDTAANYYMADVGHIMGAKIETDMRKDLFAHLQKLSYSCLLYTSQPRPQKSGGKHRKNSSARLGAAET